MSQQELVRTVVQVLEEASIAYFLTGSVASSYQGEPRASHDIDVVVQISGGDVERIGDAFSDALRVFEVQGDCLNTAYLDEWAAKMDLTDLLKKIVEDATPI